jgi:hypothetical protein
MNLNNWLKFSVIGLALVAAHAVFAGEDDDLFQNHQSNLTVDKSRQHNYVGSRDEQRLEVQVALPQPSRNPDGTSVMVEDADEPATTNPDTD